MRYGIQTVFILALIPCVAAAAQGPEYTAGDQLILPADYREWIFLTSSLDLNYDEAVPGAGRRSLLDNVFVNPDAYGVFMKTGTWPDKTVLVKENRTAASAGSISKSGKFQTAVASMELHVKDEARFPGKWAFFVSDGKTPARLMPQTASCYSCHEQHAAVDTTFVQFYPTLLEIAKAKGTLSPAYLKEERATAATPGTGR
jgi:Cytochrome P460